MGAEKKITKSVKPIEFLSSDLSLRRIQIDAIMGFLLKRGLNDEEINSEHRKLLKRKK